MTLPSTTDSLSQFPDELIRAIHRQAEQDADYVAHFLSVMVEQTTELRLPSEFLLELAAVLRIAIWEEAGIHRVLPHLPASKTALRDVLLAGAVNQIDTVCPLSRAVSITAQSQLVWHWEQDQPLIAFSNNLNDEEFGRNLAIFLWNHRHLIGESCEQKTTV